MHSGTMPSRSDRWWPTDPAALADLQLRLAAARPPPWTPGDRPVVGGCFVCSDRGGTGPGKAGDPVWAAAVAWRSGSELGTAVVNGSAGGPYLPGLLAVREGPPLAAAVATLSTAPEVVLVNATGRDHPRRAGLALHLGAALDLPSVGVTHRPLLAAGEWPADRAGAVAPLRIDGERVGVWVRTRRTARPLAVSPGWRVDGATAVRVVLAAGGRVRTPEPIRRARRLARKARSEAHTGC